MTGPVHINDLGWEEWSVSDIHRLRYKPLHDVEDAHMGVCLAELPPGCNTEPAHYHSHEEEHIYVLRGRLKLRLGDTEHILIPGSYVCFPSGQNCFHALYNESNARCEYLLWGERDPRDIVTFDDQP